MKSRDGNFSPGGAAIGPTRLPGTTASRGPHPKDRSMSQGPVGKVAEELDSKEVPIIRGHPPIA